MPEKILIDVCIASYKRQQLLAQLLASLAAQNLPGNLALNLIVVDNDPDGTAREPVKAASAGGLKIKYFLQPKQNIALTRNMGVANSTAEYIAFIDDDEYAEPDWINSLYQTMQKFNADVVFGPVTGVMPADAPAWMKQGKFFERERYATGTPVAGRGTGNVLLRAAALPDKVSPFNPKYGLSGGEDTDFFKRLSSHGRKFIWCDEAEVWEAVLPERLSLKWLFRRSFRGGQIYADIYMSDARWHQKAVWFIYRSALVLLATIAMLIAWPIRKVWGVKCLQKVASNAGQLSSLGLYRYNEYAEKM